MSGLGWNRSTWRADRWLLGAILTLALVLRVSLVVGTRHLRLGSDPTDYDRLARLLAGGRGWGQSVLAAGRGPTAFRPPLYPLFLAGVYKITGGSLTAARLTEALLGTLTVALIGWVAFRLMGRRAAICASVLAAVYPALIVYSTAVLSESIFVPLELGALAAALQARQAPNKAWRWSVVAGALLGLGILARPNSFLLVLPLGALVVTQAQSGTRLAVGSLAQAALLVVCAGVVVTPWLIRDEVVMHAAVPVSDIDAFNVAGVYNIDSGSAPFPYHYQFRAPVAVASMAPLFHDTRLGEISLSDKLRTRGLSYIAHHPEAVPEAMFWNTYRLAELAGRKASRITMAEAGYGPHVADATLVAWFVLALFGLAGVFTSSARRMPLAVVAMPVVLWLVSVPFLGTARLRNPIEPFIVLIAAAAIVSLLDRRRDGPTASPRKSSPPTDDQRVGSVDIVPLVG